MKFDNRGRLEELAVEPKYFFEESYPEWKKSEGFTYLSQVEYRNLVTRLDAVKQKGILTQPRNDIAVVTNSTAWYKEIYEHAALEWAEFPNGSGILLFRITYPKFMLN